MTKYLDFKGNVVGAYLKASQYFSTNLTAGLRKLITSEK